MIDSDILDELPDEQRKIVQVAFNTIRHSGVIESQMKRLLVQMSSGDLSESDERLAIRIREYRRQFIMLESLKHLGEEE